LYALHAAGVEVQRNTGLGQVVSHDELVSRVRELQRSGGRVVFTNGCFDLLHPGHLRLLEEARTLGDALIVGVNSDASLRGNKGAGRPITPEAERAEILAALSAVDYVVIFSEPTPRELISAVLPDVLVKGSDWGPGEIVGSAEVEATGGRVVSIPLQPGYSTTGLLARIRASRP
jgi:rfaE bifunctional protein nucleotidyltransferase chain/domain